jgi:hypothetical protein
MIFPLLGNYPDIQLTMRLSPGNKFQMSDAQRSALGTVVVQGWQDDWLLGKFAPGPAHAAFARLFADHEESVNDQLFGVADKLESAIEALGLRLSTMDGKDSFPVTQVQIMNDDGFCCKVQAQAIDLTVSQSKNGPAC